MNHRMLAFATFLVLKLSIQRAFICYLSGSVAVKVPVGADVTQCVVGGATVASPKQLLSGVNVNTTGVAM